MDGLLTAKQVQELLKVDRTTVYRMLKSGRLVGSKIGGHWRFSRQDVLSLVGATLNGDSAITSASLLPLSCVQSLQEIFSDMSGVASVTVSPDGSPLTAVSGSCLYCDLILASPSGRSGCVSSWGRLVQPHENQPRFFACHAGLQYARSSITVRGELMAHLIAGQFRAQSSGSDREWRRLEAFASRHDIDPLALREALQQVQVLEEARRNQVGQWLQKMATMLSKVARDCAGLIDRLQSIAAMSALEPETKT